MDWEKKLKDLNGYNISFEVKQGYYHIALTFEDGWSVLAPDNESIYVEERNGTHHYIASIEDVKLDDMFSAIETTISYNLDLQKKLALFKEKTQELQELFANEDFDKLQTIRFVFEKPLKKETKKKQTDKKTKSKTKKTQKKEKTAKQTKEEEITQDEMVADKSFDYDANDEIVVMSDNYVEELEK